MMLIKSKENSNNQENIKQNRRINSSCVRVVYQNRIPSLISVFITSFLPLIIGYQKPTRAVTIAVVALLWIYVIINFSLSRWFNNKKYYTENLSKWGLLFYFEHFFLALILTSIFYYYVSQHIEGSIQYLILVTLGFSAGSVSAFHQLKWAPPIFIVTSISPQIFYHLLMRTQSSYIIAVMLMIIMVFMCIISFEQHKNWIKTLSMSFELEDQKVGAENLARIDVLTGLYNRRAFYDIAPKFIKNSIRSEQPISIAMLDIDYFKKINDQYGHSIGDEVLIKVASTLKARVRESDTVARFGGEEFVILLPDTTQNEAYMVLEILREKISLLDFSEFNAEINVTSSFGLYTACLKECELDDLLKKSDSALYKAKNQGRNKVVMY